jgi:hypothetical protein
MNNPLGPSPLDPLCPGLHRFKWPKIGSVTAPHGYLMITVLLRGLPQYTTAGFGLRALYHHPMLAIAGADSNI